LLLGALTIIISYPGTTGDFWFDDKSNIVSNSTLPITEFSLNQFWKASWSSPASEIGRPLSMLSFALNSYFSQFDPYAYKLSNIVLHTINAILFFYLSIALLKLPTFNEKYNLSSNHIFYLALSISLIWALAPINIANILYVVQRMNELATLFVILGTLLYIHIRTSKKLTVIKQVLYFCVFVAVLLMAVLSKENGALLAALVLVIEVLLWQSESRKPENKYFFQLILIFLVIIPGLVVSYWFITHINSLIESYELRSFTLTERLLTEPRVLFFYIQQTLFPAIYKLSFYHDDYIKSTSLYTPFTTIVAALSLFMTLSFALLKRKHYPILFFGVFWFVIGHSLESSIIALELVFEHRNYLPSYGLIFFLLVSLFLLSQKYQKERIFYAVIGIYIIAFSLNSFIVSSVRGNTTLMLKTLVEEHPESARSNYAWAQLNETLYHLNPDKPEYYDKAIKHATIATELDPNLINGLIYSFLLKQVKNIPAQKDLNQLMHRLATVKPHNSNNRVLKKLFELAISKPELFSKQLLDKIVNVYLSNPKLTGRTKAIFYKDYANYLFETNGMSMEVLDFLTKAVNEYPESIELKLFLIQGLVNLQQYHAVEKLLPMLQEMDKFNRHQVEIDSIIKILDEKFQPSKH